MDNYPTVDIIKGRLVFLATFSLHKTLVALASQELKDEINIKEEFGFFLGFDFRSKVMEKVFGGMLFGDRL